MIPQVPDYGNYIKAMTEVGNRLSNEWAIPMKKWADEAGIKVEGIADTVSGRAGALADTAAGQYPEMMAKWKQTYQPLYEAQAGEAMRGISEMGRRKEQAAGEAGAEVGQAFDASWQSEERRLRSQGLKAPGSGADRLDAMVGNQRRLAQVASMQAARKREEDRIYGRVSEAQQAGQIMPQIAGQGANIGLAAGNQQIGAPESAITTHAGAYAPGLSAQQAALPWMKTWGDTMSNSYNQQLAAEKMQMEREKMDEASGGGGEALGMLAGLAGTAAGSFLGPMGAGIGGSLGKMAGGMLSKAEGGLIAGKEGGDNVVDPSMSGSEGAITDDVPARLNVGEFVIPKDVVAWKGEEFFQRLIEKTRAAREGDTVAEPEMAPANAIDAQPPSFVSEGAAA